MICYSSVVKAGHDNNVKQGVLNEMSESHHKKGRTVVIAVCAYASQCL